MSSYIDVVIDTDPQDIMDDFVTFMQTVVPGWEPSPGQLDVWLMQMVASAAADTRDVASAVPKSIFRWFGANLVNLPPIDDTPATTTSKWTVQDNLGYTIPAGTQVSIAKTGTDLYAFETVVDVTILPGAVQATGVQLVAVNPGADSSGLGGVNTAVQLIDPLSFVTAITQDAVTTGGGNAEDDDAYLTRLAAQLQLSAPRPILPGDFAVFARNIAGVARATAIDGYNPGGGGTFNNPRTISVAAIDANGNALDAGHKASVLADLQARREVNFQIFVIDPTFNIIDVTYQVKALAGYDLPTLVASINAAIVAYLNPATWGTGTDPKAWSNQTIVRYLEIAQVINQVPGVDYITTTAGNLDLQTAIHGNALGRADLALVGVAPLPTTVGGALNGVAT